MKTLAAHNKPVNNIAYSPDGRRLALGCAGGVLKVIDLASGAEVFRGTVAGMFPNKVSVVFSREGDRLFATNSRVHVVDLDSGASEGHGHPSTAYFQLSLSPNGAELWAAGDGRLERLATDTWDALARPKVPSAAGAGMITWPGVSVSPCGESVAFSRKVWSRAGNVDAIFVCGVNSGSFSFTDTWKGHEAKRIAFHPDGRFLAAACGPVLRVWDLTAGTQLAAIKVQKLHFMAASFSPCGRYLAAVSKDETARFWPVGDWNNPTTYKWGVGKLLDLAFAPDGGTAAVVGDKGKVVVFDVD